MLCKRMSSIIAFVTTFPHSRGALHPDNHPNQAHPWTELLRLGVETRLVWMRTRNVVNAHKEEEALAILDLVIKTRICKQSKRVWVETHNLYVLQWILARGSLFEPVERFVEKGDIVSGRMIVARRKPCPDLMLYKRVLEKAKPWAARSKDRYVRWGDRNAHKEFPRTNALSTVL